MLLNKYENLSLIAKDAYAEELLFKIEKNFGNFQQLQDKCFGHLAQLASIGQIGDYSTLKQADDLYIKLLPFAAKFN